MTKDKKESSSNTNYSIDVRLGNQAAQRFIIEGRTTLGKSSECDVKIDGSSLAPMHMAFSVQSDVLSVTHLAKSFSMILDKQELEYGRSYILDRGDKIHVGDVEIAIKKDELLTAKKGAREIETTKTAEKIELKEPTKAEISNNSKEDTQKSSPDNSDSDADKESLTTLFKQSELGVFTGDQKQEEKLETKADRPSFFSRFYKKSAKTKTDINIKKKFSLASYSTPIGIAPRFYSLLLDGALIYATKYFIVPFFKLEGAINPFIEKLILLIDKFQIDIITKLTEEFQKNHIPIEIPKNFSIFIKTEFLNTDFISLFIYFILIELSAHLLCGSSFGLFLLGAKSSDDILKSRFKSLVKCLVGFITLPFIVFDLPIIFGKKSFKEFVTFSNVEINGKMKMIFSGVLLIPLLILLSLVSPIFFSLEDINGYLVNENIIKYHHLNQDEVASFAGRIPNTDLEFHGHLFNPQKKGDMIEAAPLIFASYSPQISSLTLFQQEKSKILQIDISNEIKIRPMLNLLDNGNPLFPLIMPQANYLTTDDSTLSNIESQTEIVEIIKDSFSLSLENFPEYLIKYGPFVSGTLQFRRSFLKMLGVARPSEISLSKVAGLDYISVIRPESNEQTKKYYINLDFSAESTYHIIFSYNDSDQIWANNMISKFLRTIKNSRNKKKSGQEKSILEKEFDFMSQIYSLSEAKNIKTLIAGFITKEDETWWISKLKLEALEVLKIKNKTVLQVYLNKLKTMANKAEVFTHIDLTKWDNGKIKSNTPDEDNEKVKHQIELIKQLINKMNEIYQATQNQNLSYFDSQSSMAKDHK